MNSKRKLVLLFAFMILIFQSIQADELKWWREARFGLFIHWGLYAVPAGSWDGETNYAEWINYKVKLICYF